MEIEIEGTVVGVKKYTVFNDIGSLKGRSFST